MSSAIEIVFLTLAQLQKQTETANQLRAYLIGEGNPSVERINDLFISSKLWCLVKCEGEIVASVRAASDGVYNMLWDLSVSGNYLGEDLKKLVISSIVSKLSKEKHSSIAALICSNNIDLYESCGLSEAKHLMVIVPCDPIGKQPSVSDEYKILKNIRVSPFEVRNLFDAVCWRDEVEFSNRQIEKSFNKGLFLITVRDECGKLVAMVRAKYEGNKQVTVWNLISHPSVRGNTLGLRILYEILDEIEKSGFEMVGFGVNKMVPIYKKHKLLQPAQDLILVTNNSKL